MKPQMDVAGKVNLSDPKSVISAIGEIYYSNYKDKYPKKIKKIKKIFKEIKTTILFAHRLFEGNIKGYQRCDAEYHPFSHTTGTVLAMAGIFDGMNNSPDYPDVSISQFLFGIKAGMVHDTGLIKEVNDDHGTGAKYISKSVERSLDVLNEYMLSWRLSYASIEKIGNIIRYTGPNLEGKDLEQLENKSPEERITGLVLCTADILSQMAVNDYYPDKLIALYNEFEEGKALDDQGVVPVYESADDLIIQTPDFWKNTVLPKLEDQCESLYRALEYHFKDSINLYIKKIEENIERIKQSELYRSHKAKQTV